MSTEITISLYAVRFETWQFGNRILSSTIIFVMHTNDGSDIFPSTHPDKLRLRARLLDLLREFFKGRGFLEVETPLLSADTVVDRHIEPIRVDIGRPMWLQTSPEFCMKRMLAAGAKAIFQVTKAFRADEQGALHNVEFTLAEWYRVGDSMPEGMRLLDELSCELISRGPADLISYQDAFQRHVGIDPHCVETKELKDHARRLLGESVSSIDTYDRDGALNLLLAEFVEPHLGRDRPVILFDYPVTQAALAVVRNEDPPVAERFELYVDGVELANGYHELLDADVLRKRNSTVNEQRVADGNRPLPEESRLLEAMDYGLPACTGVALGFDRLVMIVAGANTLSEVIAFPFDRA